MSWTDGGLKPPRSRRRGQALLVAIAIFALIGLAFGLNPFTHDALASERGFSFQSWIGQPIYEARPPFERPLLIAVAPDVRFRDELERSLERRLGEWLGAEMVTIGELPRAGDEVAEAIIAIDVEEKQWLWTPIAATSDYTVTFVALDLSETLSWPENPWDRDVRAFA